MAENNSYIWAKNLGGINSDISRDISVDSAGNVYTTGFFDGTADFDPGIGTFNLSTNGLDDIFISKLNSQGNLLWAKNLGGTNNDNAYGISVDSAGNVYTTGGFQGTADFDPGAGTANLTSNGLEVFVSKLDSNGNFLWAKNFPQITPGLTSIAYDISVDSAGNIYTTGYFDGTVDFDPGAGTFNLTSNNTDIFISKLDSNGNFLWAKNLGGSGIDWAFGISVDSTGNVYTTGYFNGTADFDPGAGVANLNNNGLEDIFVSKLDSNGNYIWAKNFGGSASDTGSDINVDSAGNVYTTGGFNGTVDFDPDVALVNNLTSNGADDIFVSKLDSNGNYVWAKNLGGLNSDTGFGISLDSTGNVYTTGSIQGTADFDPGAGTANLPTNGLDDTFISKLDNNGNYIWAQSFGGVGQDVATGITLDESYNIYTTGYFSGTVDFDPNAGTANLTSAGADDGFISKLGIIPFEPINAGLTGVTGSDGVWGDYDNDGDLDVLISGVNSPTNLYQNNAGTFSIATTLPEASSGALAWGDYDNDGDLDIAFTGYNEFSVGTAQIYRNDGGIFNNIGAGFLNFYASDLAWGDYDNDGDLDLLINGSDYSNNIPTTKIYRNEGADTFVDSGTTIIGLEYGSVAWGDYDNDQDLDVVITGQSLTDTLTKIYRNDGGTFTDINAVLTGVNHSDAAWGDYDNDGDLDLGLTGIDSLSNQVTQIYNNTGGVFSPVAALVGVTDSSIAWGDYDNDGDLDLVVTGSNSAIVYRNEGANTFVDISTQLPTILEGSATWGDYNNDNTLNLLLTGSGLSEIYKNNSLLTNTIPTSPTNLNTIVTSQTLNLNWNPATDNQTPTAGLTYNLRVGTTPGGSEIVSPQSSLPQIGNVNHNTNWTLNLPYGTYYWSVQAVDTAFGRSSFAPEATLIVPPPTYDFGNITYTTPEGNITATPNVVEIVRTGDTTVAEDVTVTAISGTATAGNDYTTALFTVSFVANEPSAFVPIEILGDLGVEPDETLDLQITGFSGSGVVGTQGTTTLTLTNDDTSYQFSAASYTTPEGNTTTTPNLVEIVRTGDTTVAEDVTVTAISGTATAGSDYKAGPFLVSFIPSQTNAFVSLEILGDLIDESDENIDLQITGFSGDGVLGTLTNATLSLTDDDTTGVSITQTGSSTDIAEGGLSDTYNIVLNSVPTAPVTITATPSNPEVDLGLGAGVPLNLSFAADTTALTPQTVNITATNDNIAEGNHSSIITHSLSSSDPNYNAPNTPFTVDGIAGNTVTANITDNDSIGINLTTTDTLTSEAGDTGNFSIALTSQPTSDVLITL
ncbi:beta strand repeat-containing protein, partial [Planktothrix tepida]